VARLEDADRTETRRRRSAHDARILSWNKTQTVAGLRVAMRMNLGRKFERHAGVAVEAGDGDGGCVFGLRKRKGDSQPATNLTDAQRGIWRSSRLLRGCLDRSGQASRVEHAL